MTTEYFHGERYYDNLIDKDELKKRLPEVGMVLLKKSQLLPGRREGKVVYVNRAKLWYEVQFKNGNLTWKECFKIPEKTPGYC